MAKSKIEEIQELSEREIKDGADFYDVANEDARINGEMYPMFYAKIINKQIENEMPFILFLGKPGTGKTEASGRLGYDLTEKIDYYDGSYNPSDNMKYRNLEFLEELYESRNRVLHKPDINATLNVVDHHEDENRTFENFIHLARIFGNLVTGDAQYLWRCDTGVQITHTFRIVATPEASKYEYDVYYIDREPDAEKREVDKQFLQRWKPDRPPNKIREYIKKHDEKEKKQIMGDQLEKAKQAQKSEIDGLDLA